MRRHVDVERHLVVAMTAAPEPMTVARLVDGDAIYPRAKAGLPAEAMDCAEDTKEDFLREVERFVAVAEQIDRQLHDHPLVFSDEFGAGRLIPRCTPLHQRGFADADIRPICSTGLLHDGVLGYLHHYSQVRPQGGSKVPGAEGIRSDRPSMRRAILIVSVLTVAGVAAWSPVRP